MNIKAWVWCLQCERAFSVLLSKKPGDNESAFDFGAEFEMQLGVEQDDTVYAECPYDDCDGSLLDFWWWEEFQAKTSTATEVPELDKEYPLYSA